MPRGVARPILCAMAKAHDTWRVLGHGPLEQLADGVWRVEGSLPGMALKRVMTIARLANGSLVVHNAIALDDKGMSALDALGKVAFILVPNGYHRLDAPTFAKRYPEARVLVPRGARAKVAEVVNVSGDYGDFPADPRVKLEHLDGVRDGEGVMSIESDDGVTLVLNDVVFNMPHLPGFGGFVVRALGSSGGPRVTRIARTLLIKDKRAVRAHLERLAATPRLKRIVVSHHEVITDDPGATLARVAATL